MEFQLACSYPYSDDFYCLFEQLQKDSSVYYIGEILDLIDHCVR